MKAKTPGLRIFMSSFFMVLFILFIACSNQPSKKKLEYKNYPNLQIGFSTQNFLKAMPNSVANLTELIEYASKEGYQFIEIRDELAKLTASECEALAEVAKKNKVDVIYELHKNPLDTGFFKVFERGLANTLLFPGPGILRTVLSRVEFDTVMKGWTKAELNQLTKMTDSCATIARSKNMRFIVENFNEPFLGNDPIYFGLSDMFAGTKLTGLQFDLGNPFRKPVMAKADPEKVLEYLPSLGNRWVTTHLKTVLVMGGDMQAVLSENPLPIEKVVDLMAKQNVIYGALELAALPDKQQCYDNHAASIKFLKDIGVLKN